MESTQTSVNPAPAFVRTGWQQPSGLLSLANWQQSSWNRWSFQHVRELIPSALISRGDGAVWQLPHEPESLRAVNLATSAGQVSLAAFLESSFTDGFVVLHKGRIVTERYYHGMARDTRHLLLSVSKSLTGTVAGALIGDGRLAPEALVTDYLPELRGSSFEGATLRHVLDMTTGTRFSEAYADPASDVVRLQRIDGWLPPQSEADTDVLSFAASLPNEASHGEAFRYRSILTDLLGLILERASGLTLAEALSRHLWTLIGAEHDAEITVDRAGEAVADGGISATLRDLARVGQLYLQDGCRDGRQILPPWWVTDTALADATCREAFAASPEASSLAIYDAASAEYKASGHYRNQWWVPDPQAGVLLASGIYGQCLYVNGAVDVVVAKLSSQPEPFDALLAADTIRVCNALACELAA
jgi:CubicO group peptidase (beta-lactamase class C family)